MRQIKDAQFLQLFIFWPWSDGYNPRFQIHLLEPHFLKPTRYLRSRIEVHPHTSSNLMEGPRPLFTGLPLGLKTPITALKLRPDIRDLDPPTGL